MTTTLRLSALILLLYGCFCLSPALLRAADEGEDAAEVAGLSEEEQARILAESKVEVELRDVGKERWIDQELRLAAELSKMRYDNLAASVLEELGKGTGWGEPLSKSETEYLKTKKIKIDMDLVFEIEDAKEKIKRAEQTLAALRTMRDELPDGVHKREASIDLASGYFRLGEAFLTALREGGPAEEEPRDKDKKTSIERIGELSGKITGVHEQMRWASKQEKKKFQKELDGFEKKLREEISKSGLGGKAAGYFVQGMAVADPLLKDIIGKFEDVSGSIETAPARKREALQKMAESVFLRRVRLQHMMEKAYASWIFLFPRGSSGRDDVLARWTEYSEVALWDYEYYYPADKIVYIHWITLLGALDDPIGEKGDDGKPIQPIDTTNDQAGDYMRYQWPSTRAKFLFQHHFVNPQLPKGWQVPPAQRIQGLYYYTEAMTRFARGAFKKAETVKNGKQKRVWQEHAEKLLEDSLNAYADLTSETSKALNIPIDEGTRNTARLQIGSELYLYLAEEAIRRKDTEAAKEHLAKGMEQCSLVAATSPGWKKHASRYLQDITDFAEKNKIELVSIDAILAEADQMMRAWRESTQLAEKTRLLNASTEKYLEALRMAKSYTDKEKRAAYLVNICSRAGVNALRQKDYLTAYVLNFAVAREFTPEAYPRATFGAIQRRYELCLSNLRFAASKLRRERDTDYAKRLYVDALLLGIARTEEGGAANPDLAVMLINELRGLGLYEEALEYIADVEPSHLYYRTTLLMGAGICQALLDRTQARLARLPDPDAPTSEGSQPKPEGAELEALKKTRAELQQEVEAHARRAVEFSVSFLAELDKRPPLDPARATEKQKDVYADEVKNIPAALMIPMNIAFSAEQYDRVIELADDLARRLPKVQAIPADARQTYQTTAYFLKLVAQLRLVPVADAPVEDVWKNLEVAAKILPDLKKADRADGERVNQAYLLIGASWNNLGNRLARMLADPPAGASTEEIRKQLDACRVNSADKFAMAEGAVYEQLALGLKIGRIYSDQGMHEKAESVYDEVIRYWADSLYTPGYLFQSQKGLKDLKSASVPAALADVVKALPQWNAITEAGGEKALIEALNRFIVEVKPGARSAQLQTALQQVAGGAGLKDAAKANIAQARELLTRPKLDASRELSQRVNRVVLEAAYGNVLALSERMPVLPTEKAYDLTSGMEQPAGGETGGFGYKYPASREGRTKAAILKAMHDPRLIRTESDKQMVSDYVELLKGRLLAATTTSQRRTLQNRLDVLETGLRTPVYGVESGGKILHRNYGRALRFIGAIFEFDQSEFPLTDPAEVPTKPFLEELKDGLRYNLGIFDAQKRYVETLLTLGKSDKAIVYLRGLLALYPNDSELKLGLANAETRIAEASKSYGTEQGQGFMRARLRIMELYDRVNRSDRGSALWWEAKMALLRNGFAEVKLRHDNKKATVDIKTPWKKLHQGRTVEVDMVTEPSLEKQGSRLLTEILRLRTQIEQGLEVNAQPEKALDTWEAALRKMGFTPPERRMPDDEDDPVGEIAE